MSQTIARSSNGGHHLWWFAGRDDGYVFWALDDERRAVSVPDDDLAAVVADLGRLGYPQLMAYPCDEPEPLRNFTVTPQNRPCWLRFLEAAGALAQQFMRWPK